MSESFHFLLAPQSLSATQAFTVPIRRGENPTIDTLLLQELDAQSFSPSSPPSPLHPSSLSPSDSTQSYNYSLPALPASSATLTETTTPPNVSTSSHRQAHTQAVLTHDMDRSEAQRLCRGMVYATTRDGHFICPVAGCTSAYSDRQSVVRHLWETDVACIFCGKVVTRGNESSNMQRHRSTIKCQEKRREKEAREALEAQEAASHSKTSRTRKRHHDGDEHEQDENEDPFPRAAKRVRAD